MGISAIFIQMLFLITFEKPNGLRCRLYFRGKFYQEENLAQKIL